MDFRVFFDLVTYFRMENNGHLLWSQADGNSKASTQLRQKIIKL